MRSTARRLAPTHPRTHRRGRLAALLLAFALCFGGLAGCESAAPENATQQTSAISLANIPAYAGQPYVEVDANIPAFTDEDRARASFEEYAPLDALGRCGTAFSLVGHETMPTEKRDRISEVHPTGWHATEYDDIDGLLLFNRCHLLGYQLTAENANERNLITGTRYLNTQGMQPFEDGIAVYVRETGNHVLYRVTPVFEGDNLVASGVHMEAQSVEDGGSGVSFNVYCYNVQPGIDIDYATGASWREQAGPSAESASQDAAAQRDCVLNTNTRKFHNPDCPSVADIGNGNRQDYHGTRKNVVAQGYAPCGSCNP